MNSLRSDLINVIMQQYIDSLTTVLTLEKLMNRNITYCLDLYIKMRFSEDEQFGQDLLGLSSKQSKNDENLMKIIFKIQQAIDPKVQIYSNQHRSKIMSDLLHKVNLNRISDVKLSNLITSTIDQFKKQYFSCDAAYDDREQIISKCNNVYNIITELENNKIDSIYQYQDEIEFKEQKVYKMLNKYQAKAECIKDRFKGVIFQQEYDQQRKVPNGYSKVIWDKLVQYRLEQVVDEKLRVYIDDSNYIKKQALSINSNDSNNYNKDYTYSQNVLIKPGMKGFLNSGKTIRTYQDPIKNKETKHEFEQIFSKDANGDIECLYDNGNEDMIYCSEYNFQYVNT